MQTKHIKIYNTGLFQLERTVNDLFRLVPLAFFVLIPFMEFLLPVALKLVGSFIMLIFLIVFLLRIYYNFDQLLSREMTSLSYVNV